MCEDDCVRPLLSNQSSQPGEVEKTAAPVGQHPDEAPVQILSRLFFGQVREPKSGVIE
jgi:hypothetical protein